MIPTLSEATSRQTQEACGARARAGRVLAYLWDLILKAVAAWLDDYAPSDVWIGAAVTALLFNVGKLAIGLYLGKAGVTSGFGAAGSLVAILVWVYYSGQVFLLGAEFTWVFAHSRGSRAGETPEPAPDIPARSDT